MTLRRSFFSLFAALGLMLMSTLAAFAQDGSPTPSSATMQPPPLAVQIDDVSGKSIGTATFTGNADNSVTVEVNVSGLKPGEHGIHIHENGVCDPSGADPFASAGAHFNPTNMQHGAPIALTAEATPSTDTGVASPITANVAAGSATPEAGSPHDGDLGNITVDASGAGTLTITTSQFTLMSGQPNTLQSATGTAIVIHDGKDDLMTQPSGDSGGRIACGVVFAPQGTPVAS